MCVGLQTMDKQMEEGTKMRSSAEKLKIEPTARQHALHITAEEGAWIEMSSPASLPFRPNKQSYRHRRHKYKNKTRAEVMPKTITSQRGQAQSTLHVFLQYSHRKLSNCFFHSFFPRFFLLLTLRKKNQTDHMPWRIIWIWKNQETN